MSFLELIITLATAIQFAGAFYVLYLTFKFEVKRGWLLIFLAFSLMGIRRLTAVGVLYKPEISEAVRAYFLETMALVISVVILLGTRALSKELRRYINELKHTQGKLMQAEKLSALGRFTADVAHEIRNPLATVGGFARRLEKRLINGTREKEYAVLIVSEVDRLERILRDVLTFSREAKFRMDYHNINDVIKESLSAFAGIYREQSLVVRENLDTSIPSVFIDKDHARQAINNLISNAIDAMPEGGTLSIRSHMESFNEIYYVAVTVTDTGVGIQDDRLQMIFEPFYTTKEIGRGTGLGLPLCKKIMDEHNGLIRASSTVGKGSSFTLYFPYQGKDEDAKAKCWEFLKCGIEEDKERTCPAYPDYGRICWAVAGTLSEGKTQCIYAYKIGDCRKCEFYQRIVVRKDL
jgi:signal transduction histidine kinase